ncbi:hypothetical protein VaNZ11_010628 [Volvox africanus]|uniref:MaoC-like domain-containing protein n=1 Tax=Volvox africanus TaxID=51714 RepID=A0ABQ5S9R7_9CHLO|nr:hypothetical protein VaNZ11_010628 [Volvox africanus]
MMISSSVSLRHFKNLTAVRARALHVGQSVSDVRTFNAKEVKNFVQLTGDSNPIHTEEPSAQKTGFGAPLLPGILVASLFPAIIGSKFPGTVYASQTLSFRNPALVGQAVKATVTVRRVKGRWVTFKTVAVLQGTGQIIVDGDALALLPGHDTEWGF